MMSICIFKNILFCALLGLVAETNFVLSHTPSHINNDLRTNNSNVFSDREWYGVDNISYENDPNSSMPIHQIVFYNDSNVNMNITRRKHKTEKELQDLLNKLDFKSSKSYPYCSIDKGKSLNYNIFNTKYIEDESKCIVQVKWLKILLPEDIDVYVGNRSVIIKYEYKSYPLFNSMKYYKTEVFLGRSCNASKETIQYDFKHNETDFQRKNFTIVFPKYANSNSDKEERIEFEKFQSDERKVFNKKSYYTKTQGFKLNNKTVRFSVHVTSPISNVNKVIGENKTEKSDTPVATRIESSAVIPQFRSGESPLIHETTTTTHKTDL